MTARSIETKRMTDTTQDLLAALEQAKARAEAAEAEARSWRTVALSNQAMAQSHAEQRFAAEAEAERLRGALMVAQAALIEASVHIADSPVRIRRNRKLWIDDAYEKVRAALGGAP
jgi:hypothetical protein